MRNSMRNPVARGEPRETALETCFRQGLDCGSPLPLCGWLEWADGLQSAGGPAHSKPLARSSLARQFSWMQGLDSRPHLSEFAGVGNVPYRPFQSYPLKTLSLHRPLFRTYNPPVYLLLPLLSSVLYVCGALFLKQAGGHGVGLWRTTFVANLICGLAFNVLWFLGGSFPAVSLWWQPGVVGLLFLGGQILSFLAIERGDVSVATPVLGVKVVLVAVFVTFVLREEVSSTLWLAAALSSVGIIFLNRGGSGQTHHHAGFTIALGILAACCYAMFDVLVQKWSPAWGAGRFLPMLMWFVALYSLALIPFFHAPLRAVPRPAWRPLLLGGSFIAAQGIFLITALALHGNATSINVVYSARGLWSVLAVWWLGHWFANTERERGSGVLKWRLLGALLLMAAIGLVLK